MIYLFLGQQDHEEDNPLHSNPTEETPMQSESSQKIFPQFLCLSMSTKYLVMKTARKRYEKTVSEITRLFPQSYKERIRMRNKNTVNVCWNLQSFSGSCLVTKNKESKTKEVKDSLKRRI